MSTGVIVAIVIGALIVLALFAVVLPRARHRKLEQRRGQAHEHREEAQVHETRARREGAAAEEQAARARREAAEAEERARKAEGERAVAQEHHERATAIDPDADADPGESRDGHAPTGETDRRGDESEPGRTRT